jgi:hypothetical protein
MRNAIRGCLPIPLFALVRNCVRSRFRQDSDGRPRPAPAADSWWSGGAGSGRRPGVASEEAAKTSTRVALCGVAFLDISSSRFSGIRQRVESDRL